MPEQGKTITQDSSFCHYLTDDALDMRFFLYPLLHSLL